MVKTYIDYLKEDIENLKNSGEDFEQSLLYIPTFFELLCNLLDQELLNKESRILVNSALGYFANPSDVLSEEVYGSFGYIDDLYVLCTVLANLESSYGPSIRKLWKHSDDYDTVLYICTNNTEKFLESKNLKEKVLRYVGMLD